MKKKQRAEATIESVKSDVRKARLRAGWTAISQLMFMCERKDGRALMVALSPHPGLLDMWGVLAVETNLANGMKGVLADHGHFDMGKDYTLREGMAVAEKLAKRWQRAKVAIEDCACEDIPGMAPAGRAAAE